MLKVAEILPASKLPTQLSMTWREIQKTTLGLESPYFCVEYIQSVASTRNDVWVAVLEDRHTIAGFFPFQRGLLGVGRPVGHPLSDYHGAIVRTGAVWDPFELIKRCGLITWEFDHLLESQTPFRAFHRERSTSPLIDLSSGYAAYRSRQLVRSNLIRRCEQSLRKIEREIGEIRFVAHSTNETVLETLRDWKSGQYLRTGARDVFRVPWITKLVHNIYSTQNASFGGVLSALYAGNELIAAHFGMRSHTVWHYWFPGYNVRYAQYSPGLLLLMKMAEHANEMGLPVIDLGKGKEHYKLQMMNSQIPLAAGAIELTSLVAFMRRTSRQVASWARGTPAIYRPL